MTEDTKQCPYCAETIKAEAIVCRYCERDLTEKVTQETAEEEERSGGGRMLILLGGLALVIGALLPWASMTAPFVGSISIKGYQGDGLISGAIGLILFVVALLSLKGTGKKTAVTALILGLLSGWLVFPKLFSFASLMVESEFALMSIGSGLYVSIIGVLLVVLGGLRGLFS